MAQKLWVPLLVLAALFNLQAAFAGTSICNDTGEPHQLAVSSRHQGGWVTEGWHPVPPGKCIAPVLPGYKARFFYYRAESPQRQFRDDSIRFCTTSGQFRIEGGTDCTARGYTEKTFAKAGSGAGEQQILLSSRSQAAGEGAARGKEPEGVASYSAEVVFQGCRPLAGTPSLACRFVGGGMELSSGNSGLTGDPVFGFLRGLPHGAPLTISGKITSKFGTYAELELQEAALRKPNRFDQMLQQIQGEWVSVRDAEDRFTITGAVRQASYGGSQMAPELISLQGSCRGYGNAGDFLMTWDSERGTSLCYQIRTLTGDQLTLRYLPRGNELSYRRGG